MNYIREKEQGNVNIYSLNEVLQQVKRVRET
nr:MAG TPA: hypothetical protein [Caudoviricetes sp.]